MGFIKYFILLCLVWRNNFCSATCDCIITNDDAICCDGQTYNDKCDALCNGGYADCIPEKKPCERGNCCGGQCEPGACFSAKKGGHEASLQEADCNPDKEEQDPLCCEGTTYQNKCDANVNGGIWDCKVGKETCAGNNCCGGRCYPSATGCVSPARNNGKEASLTQSDCDPDIEEEDTLNCEGTTFRNKCDANVNGGILECKVSKGTCEGNNCCSGRCYPVDSAHTMFRNNILENNNILTIILIILICINIITFCWNCFKNNNKKYETIAVEYSSNQENESMI